MPTDSLGEFIVSRIVQSGYKNPETFLRDTKFDRSKLHRFKIMETEEDARAGSQVASREHLATLLGFSGWAALVEGWKRWRAGLVAGSTREVAIPVEVFDRLALLAETDGVTPARWIENRVNERTPATPGGKGK